MSVCLQQREFRRRIGQQLDVIHMAFGLSFKLHAAGRSALWLMQSIPPAGSQVYTLKGHSCKAIVSVACRMAWLCIDLAITNRSLEQA